MYTPFIFGKTVSQDHFTGRLDEVNLLWESLSAGANTLIYAPRRWGKTSLIAEVAKSMKEDNYIEWIDIDLFKLRDEEEFLEKLLLSLIKIEKNDFEPWIQKLNAWLPQLAPRITLKGGFIPGLEVHIHQGTLLNYPEEVLGLADRIAEDRGRRIIIAMDDFQQILLFKKHLWLEDLLRQYWVNGTQVSYCVSLCKHAALKELTSGKKRALFGFQNTLKMSKITSEQWIKYIVKRFEKGAKTITEVQAEEIAELMEQHPYYVQQLANYVYLSTDEEVDDLSIYKALENLLDTNELMFQRNIENLSITQVNLLHAILKGETQLTSVRVMNEFKLGTPRNVAKNKIQLEKKDILVFDDKTAYFLDPAFTLWLKKYYFK